MNVICFSGHLGQDSELKTFGDGGAVCNFRIASNEKRKTKDGKWEDHTEWMGAVLWGKRASALHQYLNKGVKVAVKGRIQTRKWEDKEGNKRYTTEIVVDEIDIMSDRAHKTAHEPKPEGNAYGTSYGDQDPGDDVPF